MTIINLNIEKFSKGFSVETNPKKCGYIPNLADFDHHCRGDASKHCILLPKYILQGLCVWPDNNDRAKQWFVIIMFVNLGIMGFGHFMFLLLNFTSISKMTTALALIPTIVETMAKLITLLYYRDTLNQIIQVIWHDFWPADITSPQRQQDIKFRSTYIVVIMSTFLGAAFVSCAQLVSFPLIEGTGQLPYASWYPFNFQVSPMYEILLIWQWCLGQVVITTLSGFDSFFNALVMICATQFQVLQDVLENIFTPAGNEQSRRILQKDGATEMDVLVKCVELHNKLISVCIKIEEVFSHIIFIQFVVSTASICCSAIALKADPTLLQHMMSFCAAHVLQFFIYCSVGNELTYQSEQLADAAYNCDWEISTDSKLRKSLMMIIQRAQRPVVLTVAGLMGLSFANFVGTLQLSFSFYTLLNSFV